MTIKNTISFSCAMLLCALGIAQTSTFQYQKEVVAKMTGKEAIEKGVYLNQRATYDERSITANYLASALKVLGWTYEFQKYRTSQSNYFLDLFFSPNRGINVIGKLPATVETEQHIILGAHYDSERDSPGAVDNASGVALCLALAKELQKLKHRQYNVLIVFFDQEEDDEVGSEVYVERIQKKNLAVHSVHIFDLIGWDTDGDNALTLQSPSPFLETYYQAEAELMSIPLKTIGGAASDNKSFIKAGYATVHPFEEMDDSTPYLHSPEDTYQTVNFEFLENSTKYISRILTKILENEQGK